MNTQNATKKENPKDDNIYNHPVTVPPFSMSDGPSRVDEAAEKIGRETSSSKKNVMEVDSKSSVTGGAPEDINMMPPAVDSEDPDELVYDGSSLGKPRHPSAKQTRH